MRNERRAGEFEAGWQVRWGQGRLYSSVSTPPDPARLHILFARDAPVGVILRRGPSRKVRLLLWHTNTDVIEPGQWLKGRIYEKRVSLSPDGKLFAYFAYGHSKRAHSFEDAAWVAISRPPYLTALSLWFKSDTYGGNSAFIDNQTVLISLVDEPAPGREPPSNFHVGEIRYRSGEHWAYFTARGWREMSESTELASLREAFWRRRPRFRKADITCAVIGPYEKPLREKGLFLEWHPRGWSWRLHDRQARRRIPLFAEQAEVDPAGRLVLVREGKLLVATVGPGLVLTETELADFNDMTFEPIAPPDWAKEWPTL